MAQRFAAGVILTTVVLAVGCSANVPATTSAPRPSVLPSAPSACTQDFVRAAGFSSNSDSVSDLYPAVRDCRTLAEWSAAFDAVGGAGFTGGAASVLANVCRAAEVTYEPLCSGSGSGATAPLETAAAPTTQGSQSAAALCAGSTYTRCVANVTIAIGGGWKLFAICEYAQGEGDIVLLDKESDAEGMCSGDGLISPSKVFKVVQQP